MKLISDEQVLQWMAENDCAGFIGDWYRQAQLEADQKALDEAERKLQLLVDTLGNLLIKLGVMKDDVRPNASELIMLAEEAGKAHNHKGRTK